MANIDDLDEDLSESRSGQQAPRPKQRKTTVETGSSVQSESESESGQQQQQLPRKKQIKIKVETIKTEEQRNNSTPVDDETNENRPKRERTVRSYADMADVGDDIDFRKKQKTTDSDKEPDKVRLLWLE